MSNALYEVLREINALKGQFATPVPPTTTTSTTALPVIDSTIIVNLASVPTNVFDIPFFGCNFGCWINVTNDIGSPNLFSFGQSPTASQAISITSDVLSFSYNGSSILSYPLTSYIGNWVWIWIQGSVNGGVILYINGNQVAFGNAPSQTFIQPILYIGSENSINSYYNGLIAGFILDAATLDLRNPPSGPIFPSGSTILLLGQGGDIIQQLTDQGVFSLSVIPSNITYSASSPYSPANGGSLHFGV
jgi:hypothetical protein